MTRVLAISGSCSSRSINLTLLEYVASMLEGSEVVRVLDYPAPIYCTDEEEEHGVPDSMLALKAKIDASDAIVLASPEYNGSMPAILKNAIDWLSRVGGMKFLDGKPILLLSTSPGSNGGATNLANLATLVPWWGGDVVAIYSLPKFEANFDRELRVVTDEGHRTALQSAADALDRALEGREAAG